MRASFITYQLRLAQQNEWMTSAYTDMEDPDSVIAGYVQQVDARYVLFFAVTPWGKPDGWILRRTEELEQVFYNEDEELRLQALRYIQGWTPTNLLPPPENGTETDLLRAVLDLALREARMISLVTEEDTYTGTLTQVDDLRVTMEELDFFGRPGLQPLTLCLRDIELVAVDTEEEHMYQSLYAEQMRLVKPDPTR